MGLLFGSSSCSGGVSFLFPFYSFDCLTPNNKRGNRRGNDVWEEGTQEEPKRKRSKQTLQALLEGKNKWQSKWHVIRRMNDPPLNLFSLLTFEGMKKKKAFCFFLFFFLPFFLANSISHKDDWEFLSRQGSHEGKVFSFLAKQTLSNKHREFRLSIYSKVK